jgi:nucleoside-diphosphate-sugar epimerase
MSVSSTPISVATVIGGRGFVGSALVRHLQSLGWTCYQPEKGVSWPIFDRPLGHIFYCAGLTGDYMSRAADTVEAHVSLLVRVLQSSDWDSLVYLSSTRLYDGLPAEILAQETTLLPVAPQVPRHLFDLTKLTGESLCHALGKGRARVARLANVYLSHNDPNGFLPTLLRRVAQSRRGEVLAVESIAQSARDYVYLPDVLRALVDIAQRGTQTVYNVASGYNVSNAQLATWVAQRTGRQLQFTASSAPSCSPVVDITRLLEDFGWRPSRLELVIDSWLNEIGQENEASQS